MELKALKNTFRKKRVLITGHTGFKGSWLVHLLHALEAEVKGYALAPEGDKSLFEISNAAQYCTSVVHDINDLHTLKEEVLSFKPHFIFHLAAQSLVRKSYETPVDTYATNIMGTMHVLEAFKQIDHVSQLIVITTDKVYENKEWSYPYREHDELGGYDPYSSSKACCEILCSSYRRSFFSLDNFHKHGKSLATARAGNVIGGGDFAQDRIIPDIVRSKLAQEPLSIRNPHSVRPWQFVLEPLLGYLQLAQKLVEDPLQYSSAWNFGPESSNTATVKTLLTYFEAHFGTLDIHYNNTPQPHEANLLQLDIHKTTSKLDWYPQLDLKRSIELTAGWYKAFLEGENMENVTQQQVNTFLEELI